MRSGYDVTIGAVIGRVVAPSLSCCHFAPQGRRGALKGFESQAAPRKPEAGSGGGAVNILPDHPAHYAGYGCLEDLIYWPACR
jgi:hypothetical protein